MAKKDRQAFYNYRVTSADGKIDTVEYKSEKQFEEAKGEAAKVGSAVEILKAQSFLVTTADSIDEILEVTPNPTVALSYYNYGLTLAQHNVKRELMKDAEWNGVEGDYDLINDVQAEREARVSDPLSASRRALKALWAKTHPGQDVPTDDEINAVLASFAQTATAA